MHCRGGFGTARDMVCLYAAVLFRSGRTTACSGWSAWKWVDVASPTSRITSTTLDNKGECLTAIGRCYNRRPDPIRVSLAAAACRGEQTPGPDPGHADDPGGRAEDGGCGPTILTNHTRRLHGRRIPGPFLRDSISSLSAKRGVFAPAQAFACIAYPPTSTVLDNPRPSPRMPRFLNTRLAANPHSFFPFLRSTPQLLYHSIYTHHHPPTSSLPRLASGLTHTTPSRV